MKINFAKIARDLVGDESLDPLARRYLSIRRRLRVVHKAVREIVPGKEAPWAAVSSLLGTDPDPAIARLPALANRLVLMRRHLESELLKACSRSRFTAVVAKEAVQEALALIPRSMEKLALVIAYAPKRGLVIERRRIETPHGSGGGLAVIHRADLAQLLDRAKYGVCIEAFDDYWVGWIDSTPSGAPKGFKTQCVKFDYFCSPVECEEP